MTMPTRMIKPIVHPIVKFAIHIQIIIHHLIIDLTTNVLLLIHHLHSLLLLLLLSNLLHALLPFNNLFFLACCFLACCFFACYFLAVYLLHFFHALFPVDNLPLQLHAIEFTVLGGFFR